MPIIASEPPAGVHRAIYRALASRAATAAFAPSKLQRANPHALSIAMPHRVAYLPAENIELHVNLRQVTQIGNWRFLVHEKQQRKAAHDREASERRAAYVPIAAATAAITDAGTYELGELNEGPLVEETENAIRYAENLDVLKNNYFEAYLLIAPGVYSTALWLQERDPQADIILPMPVNPAVADQDMTPRAYLKLLYPLAQQVYGV